MLTLKMKTIIFLMVVALCALGLQLGHLGAPALGCLPILVAGGIVVGAGFFQFLLH